MFVARFAQNCAWFASSHRTTVRDIMATAVPGRHHAMWNQEQALRAYYASMTDSELLAVARNRTSFIPAAQALVSEELARRRLAVQPEPPIKTERSQTLLGELWR